MKNSIPRYTFYKTKYGSELLVDVVELKYVKRFLTKGTVHTLTYYDITFVTEEKETFLSIIKRIRQFPVMSCFPSPERYGIGIPATL